MPAKENEAEIVPGPRDGDQSSQTAVLEGASDAVELHTIAGVVE